MWTKRLNSYDISCLNITPMYVESESSSIGSSASLWTFAYLGYTYLEYLDVYGGGFTVEQTPYRGIVEITIKGRITLKSRLDNSIVLETDTYDDNSIFITKLYCNYLNVNGANVVSDDRLKHNEVVIANGLDIIDQLTPKFYQKTLTMLDASYNGDLSGHAWTYEAGLIAQELLKIPDLSFVVSGGNYYEQTYKSPPQTNDISNANYDLSNTNYDVSNNLIAQPYNVNYNSVFIYGLAAIKELHQKFNAQQATLLNQKNIINSLLTKIETLENNRNN